MVSSRNCSLEQREHQVQLLVSFETGEQVTALRVPPPPSVDWRLVGVNYEVVKALANTDVGLIDVKDSAGNVAITQISIPLSSALGVRGAGVLGAIDARLVVGAGQASPYHTVTTSKATAGGKVQLFLSYRKVQPYSQQG